jgi:hypothetical protein
MSMRGPASPSSAPSSSLPGGLRHLCAGEAREIGQARQRRSGVRALSDSIVNITVREPSRVAEGHDDFLEKMSMDDPAVTTDEIRLRRRHDGRLPGVNPAQMFWLLNRQCLRP